jgi:signal peptidase I
VPRIGWAGWCFVLALSFVLHGAPRLILSQIVSTFRIPTSTMQPTLMGIMRTSSAREDTDRPGILALILRGHSYLEVRAKIDGVASILLPARKLPGRWLCFVGDESHVLPSRQCFFEEGTQVRKGDILWSGLVKAGDCVMVERLSYRFGDPKRGDIIVFKTDGIQGIQKGTYYIKRVAGLPGERIRIDPPNLLVNDQIVNDPPIFQRIAASADGYAGFNTVFRGILSSASDSFELGPSEYLVLGDNSLNSKDSRYWGAVPRTNIFGRVTRIYWPTHRINALQRHE